jgi:hypothetical protein
MFVNVLLSSFSLKLKFWQSNLGQYSRHFTGTYERAQYARVLHYTRLKVLVREKPSSLLAPFISYEGNEVM